MKVIAVTGASAGVGRAVAQRFARKGARLGLIARGKERLEATAAEVERIWGEALVLPLDVADAEAVEDAAGQIEERFGPLDVWVNNAMTTVFAPVGDTTPDEFRRATEVTYLGAVWARWPRCAGCSRATAARSSRSVQRSRTGRSRFRPPTAARNPRFAASPNRSAPSSSTTARMCA